MEKSRIEKALIDCARSHGGIVTTWDMNTLGFSTDSLRQWAYHHRPYTKLGKGIYTFEKLNNEEDIDISDGGWFMSLAQSGDPTAYLAGESVLDFYHLGYVAPTYTVVRAHTARKHLTQAGVLIEPLNSTDQIDTIRGVRLQRLSQAFETARGVRDDYLLQAANDAHDRNLLNNTEYDKISQKLEGEFKWAA